MVAIYRLNLSWEFESQPEMKFTLFGLLGVAVRDGRWSQSFAGSLGVIAFGLRPGGGRLDSQAVFNEKSLHLTI